MCVYDRRSGSACRQGGVRGIVGQFSYPLLFSKASVVGASYKRRYTSISHANVEGDLEKRGRKGKCAIESSGGVGRLEVDGGGGGVIGGCIKQWRRRCEVAAL